MKQNKIFALLLSLMAATSALAGDSAKEKEYRLAASIGDIDTVAKLLDEGIDVNSANQFGRYRTDDGDPK